MNNLDPKTITGTLGELLVQARLLQHKVQAAPPLKDSGNDLIAIREMVIQAIQVKTTGDNDYTLPDEDKKYHILAAVKLVGDGCDVWFDKSEVYLIKKEELEGLSRQFSKISDFILSQKRIDTLFPKN